MSHCRATRDRLTAAPHEPLPPAIHRHLEGCETCQRFEQRSRALLGSLTERRSAAVPDAGFAARVVSRLPPAAHVASSRFTWAALRLLPAAAALLLVLLGWSVVGPTGDAEATWESQDSDLLTWILDEVPQDLELGDGGNGS